MTNRLTIFLVLLVILTFHTQSTDNSRLLQTVTYVTTSIRGPTVTNFCTDKINRQKIYQTYGLSGTIPHGDSVANAFNIDTSLIDAAVNNDWNLFGEKLKGIGGKIFVFVGAWVIGLAIALLIFPFLLCCCICPWACPACGRNRERMPYTKCQLVWPAVVSLILLLVILVTSIVGIASDFKAAKSYDQVACGSGILVDDITNGNVSLVDSSLYFTGVRTIDTELRALSAKVVNLDTEVAKLSSASPGVTDAKAKITSAKTTTSQIPSTTGAALTLTYNTPLQNAPGSTTGTINSLFPDILGTKSTSDSLVFAGYITLTTFQSALTTINNAANSYTSNIAQFTASLNSALNETNRYATTLESKDAQINDFFKKNRDAIKGDSIGEYVYYGVLIGLAVLMMIALSCAVFNQSKGCRYLMYGICVILFLFCLIAFVYCIFVSILNPVLYYTCQYIQENLDSRTKLYDTLANKLKISADISNNVVECLVTDGTGDIASKILGSDVYKSIDSLKTTYNSLSSLVDVSALSYITTTHQFILDKTTAVKKGQILDINDQNSLQQLIKLSQSSFYNCQTSGFSSDSWIPSVNQDPVYAGCQISGGPKSDSTTCKTTSDFNTRANGCTGCMDTFDLFKGNGTQADVTASLNARYSDATCSTFNTQLSNVWANFYKKKIDTLGPVQTRATTAKTNADAVVSAGAYFTQVKANLDGNFSSIVNSQYGLLNGLNCKVSGEDVRLLKNVVCQKFFLYTYFSRIIFGILSFALLLLMCCVTCTGRRNCRQIEFTNGPEGKYMDKDGMEENPYAKYNPNPGSPHNQYNMASEQNFVYGQNYYKNPIYV